MVALCAYLPLLVHATRKRHFLRFPMFTIRSPSNPADIARTPTHAQTKRWQFIFPSFSQQHHFRVNFSYRYMFCFGGWVMPESLEKGKFPFRPHSLSNFALIRTHTSPVRVLSVFWVCDKQKLCQQGGKLWKYLPCTVFFAESSAFLWCNRTVLSGAKWIEWWKLVEMAEAVKLI